MCVPATQVRADGAGREGEGRCSQAETGAYIQSVYLPIGATLPRQLALLLLALASYAVPLLVLVGMAWRVLQRQVLALAIPTPATYGIYVRRHN